MVRVVSCHHFVSQDVFLSENEPVAFCGAQDKLLLSNVQHAVNVHDLEARGNVLHSFPTIDIVKQIIYCESGNYVATIETKASFHQSLVSYVRVYFKWWIDMNNQSLKVRIAGCVPSVSDSAWSKSLEMVELPLEKPPLYISCCNKTSALVVSLGSIISVFCFSTKIHGDSKQPFNDFDHFVDITVPFVVQQVDVCENYFACLSQEIVHVFKISPEVEDYCNEEVVETIEEPSNDSTLYSDDYVEWRFESCTIDGGRNKKWDEQLKSKLDPSSFPINLHFYAIDKENKFFSGNDPCEYHGPLLTVRGCTVDVRPSPKIFEMFRSLSFNFIAVTLLFRQFAEEEQDSKLKTVQLVPFYKSEAQEGFADPLNAAASKSEKCTFSLPWPNFLPASSSSFKAIGCFFSSSKEGYIYDITNHIRLVSTYSYTSTMKGVALDRSLLHALTETGLETYTVHLAHSAFENLEKIDVDKNIVPKYDDAVCLLGLRPFLGVDHLVKSDNHLILVSSIEDSVSNTEPNGENRSTLYSLKEPSAIQVFTDLLEIADSQKSASPSVYYHLLSEAHMILRTSLFLQKNNELEKMYTNSCVMLADYYVCLDTVNKLSAVPYFHLSQLPIESVIKKILDYRHQVKLPTVFEVLVSYMDTILFDEKQIGLTISQSTADSILSAYSEYSPEQLWKVILCSNLKNFKIDKAILAIKKRLTNKKQPLSPISNAADTTALVYLLIQKNNPESAQTMIASLIKADLLTIMFNIKSTLLDVKTITSFGKFLKQARPDAFIEFLLSYVQEHKLQISDILQMLQAESPNTDLHCIPLVRGLLEAVLSSEKLSKEADSSVLNLLVKIYLKRMLTHRGKSTSPTSNVFANALGSFAIFFNSRAIWLNEMPPFNGKGISRTCLLTQKSDKNTIVDPNMCCCWTCNEELLRIQSFLSYLGPPEDIKALVLEFLCSTEDKIPNSLSIEVMCSNEAHAIKLLISTASKALIPYAVETFKQNKEKWSLLFTFLHEQMKTVSEDDPNRDIYSQIFYSVLLHLAETLSPVEFVSLLPKEYNPLFVPHLKRSVEKHQADQLQIKIVSLGQEIKSMMSN